MNRSPNRTRRSPNEPVIWPKVRVAETRVRVVAVQRVGDVERVDAELGVGAADVEALHERRVKVHEPRALDTRARPRHVPERVLGRQREHGRIEPELATTDLRRRSPSRRSGLAAAYCPALGAVLPLAVMSSAWPVCAVNRPESCQPLTIQPSGAILAERQAPYVAAHEGWRPIVDGAAPAQLDVGGCADGAVAVAAVIALAADRRCTSWSRESCSGSGDRLSPAASCRSVL